jgi:hypothetical protein
VRLNTKKLKGIKIGVSEQFPEEIESIRKTFYPELKKARAEDRSPNDLKNRFNGTLNAFKRITNG